MNILKNHKVISKTFGHGVIVSQSNTILYVTFEGESRWREFYYPSCFDRGLIALDEADNGGSYSEVMQMAQLMPERCQGKINEVNNYSSVELFCKFFYANLCKERDFLKSQGGRRQHLFDGKFVSRGQGITTHGIIIDTWIYSFESESELNFPDETPISIWLGERRISAILLHVIDFNVTIAITENLGDFVKSIEFSAEPWFLLDQLGERLYSLIEFSSQIVIDLICHGPDNQYDGKLRKGQDQALADSMVNPISFIWGPPGTGKTETLAKIALKHIEMGHRVLMLSYSNVSVDGAMLRLHRNGKGLKVGQIIRYGYPRNKELLAKESLSAYTLALSKIPNFNKEYNALIEERKNLSRSSRRSLEISEKLTNMRKALKVMECQLVDQADFVATTISKAVIDKLIYEGKFDVVIFDEASMAYIPQIIFAASLAQKHFICLGDFNQLPPISQCKEAKCLQWDIFQYCGITKAVQFGKGHNWLCLLDTQHRMYPMIAEFASKGIYESLIKSAPDMVEKCKAIVESSPIANKPMFLVDLSGMMTVCKKSTDSSHYNILSALLSVGMAMETAKKFEVGIIVPYNAQARLYNAMSRDIANAFPKLKNILGATVHQFQGSEKDVIIYDTVDCYRQIFSGYMLTSQTNNYANRLFNVAVTRSKGKFILVSHVDYFMKRKTRGLSSNLLLGQFLKKFSIARECMNYEKIKTIYTEDIEDVFTYYQDDSELVDFELDIEHAHEEILIDIPKGIVNDVKLRKLTKLIKMAIKRDVNVVIRAEDIFELPPDLRDISTQNEFAWNPVTIIDRRKIWFGMPYSESNFVVDDEIVETRHHPVIRFIGPYTALSLIGLLEMQEESRSDT